MKVLVVHCVYQFTGGEETVVAEESRLLKEKGVEVELLHFYNKGNTAVKYLQLPFNLFSYRKLKQKIKSFGPDVVHLHNFHFAASPSVLYAVKHSRVPLVCTLHNYRMLCPSGTLFHEGTSFPYSLQQTFPIEAVKKGVYKNSKLLTAWMAISMQLHYWLRTWQLPDSYIVLSHHAKKIFLQSKLKTEAERFVVKPNFCSLLPLQKKQRKETFVYVGRLSVEKGIPLLLRTFSHSSFQLIIAGDGPLKEDVIACCAKNKNISYRGALPKAEVLALLQQATALVFPSIWYEGMPLTIIEALACGTPVIATRLGAMEDMITAHYDGLLFEAGNEGDLRKALTEWMALPLAEKERYNANARATYEQFYTPEKNAAQLLAIYRKVQQKTKPNSLALAAS